MSDTETLLREIIAAERARADALERALRDAQALIEELRADAQKIRTRRTRDAERKRLVRGQSLDIPRTIAGHSADASADPPMVSSSSPTPLIITSLPPTHSHSETHKTAVETALFEYVRDDRHMATIVRFVDRTGERATGWIARLAMWLSGHDFVSHTQCTPELLATALGEYLDAPGNFSPAHVKDFVLRVARQNAPATPKGVGLKNPDAERLWQLCKDTGIHVCPDDAVDAEVEKLVTAGRIRDGVKFRALFAKLDLRALRTAREDRYAIASIAARLSA